MNQAELNFREASMEWLANLNALAVALGVVDEKYTELIDAVAWFGAACANERRDHDRWHCADDSVDDSDPSEDTLYDIWEKSEQEMYRAAVRVTTLLNQMNSAFAAISTTLGSASDPRRAYTVAVNNLLAANEMAVNIRNASEDYFPDESED